MNKLNRAIAPEIFIPQNIEAQSYVHTKSANGVDMYALDFSQFDVIRVSFVFRAGTKYQDQAFLANSTLSMFSEGSKNRTNKEISDTLDFYGLYFDVSIDRDFSVVTICSLSGFFDQAIEIFEEILLNPSFPEKELDVLKSKRKHALKVEREKVDYISREEFTKAIYGENHPYGVTYSESKYDELSGDDLRRFYTNNYLRDNLFVVVSGKYDSSHIKRIEAICDALPSAPFNIKISAPEPFTPQKRVIERASTLQSAIKIGRPMFPKNHEDFVPMQLLTTILGGYFGSRLIKNIREEKGYTYSIFSAMINMEDSGHFVVTTEVANEYVEATLVEVFKEMETLRNELVSDEELNMVRNVIIGEVLRILDGPFGIADVTIENIQNGYDNGYVGLMIRQINAITAEQVQQCARKYLVPEDMTIIIVGKPQ